MTFNDRAEHTIQLDKDPGGDKRRRLIAHLIECIETDSSPLIDVYEGARSAAICIAAFESLRSGRPEAVRQF